MFEYFLRLNNARKQLQKFQERGEKEAERRKEKFIEHAHKSRSNTSINFSIVELTILFVG